MLQYQTGLFIALLNHCNFYFYTSISQAISRHCLAALPTYVQHSTECLSMYGMSPLIESSMGQCLGPRQQAISRHTPLHDRSPPANSGQRNVAGALPYSIQSMQAVVHITCNWLATCLLITPLCRHCNCSRARWGYCDVCTLKMPLLNLSFHVNLHYYAPYILQSNVWQILHEWKLRSPPTEFQEYNCFAL